MSTTSALAVLGGALILIWVPNGPYRKSAQRLNLTACFTVFKIPDFRAAAFGYFGHMWELYTFWAFVPVLLSLHAKLHHYGALHISLWSFSIIAIGGVACILGGYISQRRGVKKTASTALLLSGICCLLSPFFLIQPSLFVFVGFLLFWGMVVIADSPLFSTLVAQNAPPEVKGTALTIVNCIGFAITIVSLQTVTFLQQKVPEAYLFILLAVGPIFGLMALFRKTRSAL